MSHEASFVNGAQFLHKDMFCNVLDLSAVAWCTTSSIL